MSKLRHVQFHVVTKVLCIFLVAQCTQRTQRSENASSGHLHEVKNNGKSLTVRLQKCSLSLITWSFTRGANCKALTGKISVFWIGDRLWEVVAHGGSTVYYFPLKTLFVSPSPFLQLSLEISNDIPRSAGKDILWKQIILLRVVNGRP